MQLAYNVLNLDKIYAHNAAANALVTPGFGTRSLYDPNEPTFWFCHASRQNDRKRAFCDGAADVDGPFPASAPTDT
jgi:hypothetical protein